MNRKRRKIIINVVEIIAVVLLLGPVYRFLCGIGLEKVYDEKGISVYVDDTKYADEAFLCGSAGKLEKYQDWLTTIY